MPEYEKKLTEEPYSGWWGEEREEGSVVRFVVYFPLLCYDTSHFDPSTPVKFVSVSCGLWACVLVCMCV